MCPTPPAAPVISTRLPSSGAPCRKVRNAVRPATGKAAASSKRTLSGNAAMRWAGTAARCAQPAPSVSATMRVPAAGPLPSAACCNTTPPMSCPGRQPSGRICIRRNSPRFSEKARTSTNASLAAGVGSGTSRTSTGPAPLGVFTKASMSRAPSCSSWPGSTWLDPAIHEAARDPRVKPGDDVDRPVAGRSTSVEPQIGDVLRVGLQFAAFDPGDDVGQDLVGRGFDADLVPLPGNEAVEELDLGATPLNHVLAHRR